MYILCTLYELVDEIVKYSMSSDHVNKKLIFSIYSHIRNEEKKRFMLMLQ